MSQYSSYPVIGGGSSIPVDITSSSDALTIDNPSGNTYVIGMDMSKIVAQEAICVVVGYPAGETISALQAVYQSRGSVYRGDHASLVEASVIGLAVTSGLAGETVQVLEFGVISDASFSFAPADLVFLTDNGALSATSPPSGYLTRVGRAINPTTILVIIDSPKTL